MLDAALTVACGEGAVQLLELQRAGRRPMSSAELLRGFPLPPGTRIGARLIVGWVNPGEKPGADPTH